MSLRVYVRDVARLRCQDGDWADSALATLLGVVAHECTHYFQWINGLMPTERGRERQANAYAGTILDEYAQTRDHP